MSIPAYPNHLRRCTSLNQAIDILAEQGITIKPQAIAHYVDVYGCTAWQRFQQSNQRVFSYNFFNLEGLNVGTYTPDMDSFQFQSGPDGKGRVWGVSSDDLRPYDLPLPFTTSPVT